VAKKKPEPSHEDDALLAELGVDTDLAEKGSRTAREERIIAGFEEIERFYKTHHRTPRHGENHDIFERLYAVRLEQIRASDECRVLLSTMDQQGLLATTSETTHGEIDDAALLASLGVENELADLQHIKSRKEIHAAEQIGKNTPCEDYHLFKPLFTKVQEELKSGLRKTTPFKENAEILIKQWFILNGQKTYVAEVGEAIKAPNGEFDARLRVIYDNGTESNILRRSLIRALNKDQAGRRISDPTFGPLFADFVDEDDIESGTIYVLRSHSEDPYIKAHREIIHKIGVTSGDLKKRLAAAKDDPTFLMADVEVVATYQLSNIHRVKLENLIHRFFKSAKIDVKIKDRFGKSILPNEWFLVPLHIIDEAIAKIKDGSMIDFSYDPKQCMLVRLAVDP
jgi:hypothetical protein